jgi:putative SOS response-associated peptidase YedK
VLKNPGGSPDPMASKKDVVWFVLDPSRSFFAFAGIWTEWEGARGTEATLIEGKHPVYGFLTGEPNKVVAPVHVKAMPVILTTKEEWNVWMRAPWNEASQLQSPFANLGLTEVMGRAEKQDYGDFRDVR